MITNLMNRLGVELDGAPMVLSSMRRGRRGRNPRFRLPRLALRIVNAEEVDKAVAAAAGKVPRLRPRIGGIDVVRQEWPELYDDVIAALRNWPAAKPPDGLGSAGAIEHVYMNPRQQLSESVKRELIGHGLFNMLMAPVFAEYAGRGPALLTTPLVAELSADLPAAVCERNEGRVYRLDVDGAMETAAWRRLAEELPGLPRMHFERLGLP